MSDQQIIQDMDRVQMRISRLRGRFGKHWEAVEKLPSQSASQAWNSLGQFTHGFRPGVLSGGKHWALGLLAAGMGWYLSQPGAIRRIWRIVYPYLRSWKQKPASPPEGPFTTE